MKSVDYDGEHLIVAFQVPTSDFPYVLSVVKSCENRYFNSSKKQWVMFASQKNMDILANNGFTLSPAVKALWDKNPTFIAKPIALADIDTSVLHPDMFPYQVEGVRWIEARGGSGVIGLPVGMGKSNIAASYALLHKQDRPVLVVCPACVKINWQREIKKWTGENAMILYGKTPSRINLKRQWVIVNYDILSEWQDVLAEMGFKYLIGDESAFVNNPKALRTKAFVRLGRIIPKKVLLSATPIRNRPSEFFTALNLVDRKLFPNRYKYLRRYCDPKYNGFQWTYKGLTNDEELFSLISHVMFRKKKEDVFKDLPQKRKIVVPFALTDAAQSKYDRASLEFTNWVLSTQEKKASAVKAHIETLRQLAYIGKRDAVIEWIETFLDSGEKLAVFLEHTDAINDIHHAFKDCSVIVDGHVSAQQKQVDIDAFNTDSKVRLFIGQNRAAGIGIDLTATSSLAIIEFPWTPGDIEQIMGRVDRITQKSPTVSFYYLVGAGTVDEDTTMLLDEKSKMLNKTLDGEVGEDIFGCSIADLLVGLVENRGE